MKFGFIAKHRGIWPVRLLYEMLDVSRSGFYARASRTPSARARSDEQVGALVKTSFLSSDRIYGARRVWHDMLADGVSCGLHRIERLMRIQALRARPRRRKLPADTGERQAKPALNVLDRQFVADALVMAIWRRGRPNALLHHSDRGSQYTSEQFQRLMEDHGVACSMSRSGNVWDNAAMESFFSTLKIERIRRKVYRTRGHARADVFDYIERFYNPRRRHSTIGYLSPMEFERMKASA